LPLPFVPVSLKHTELALLVSESDSLVQVSGASSVLLSTLPLCAPLLPPITVWPCVVLQEQQVVCMDACAAEYTGKVPKMKADCQQQLKKLGV
jgi:hypothetical protein